MPLRDHFRSPLDDLRHWEGVCGQWPGMMVLNLLNLLPPRYFAEPRIRPGEGVYEGLVFDGDGERRLVAAVEIVSPANKDRAEHRHAFTARCVALLQNRVSVVIIDLVTTRNFNLYVELLELIGHRGPSLEPVDLYAAACRGTNKDEAWLVETWAQALMLGQPLPTLPLWLADDLAVPLDLEASYQETCRVLRIP